MEIPRVRQSARVLLIDSRNHVLLFEGIGRGDYPRLWFPPGGRLEPDESYEQAALREVWEETGLRGIQLEACVWHRNIVFRWADELIDSRERWFVARVETLDIEGHINPNVLERQDTLGYRWWSQPEIQQASELIFVPRALGPLLAPLLEGNYPVRPLELGE